MSASKPEEIAREINQKIFEDYDVDCLDCKHYWADTCDGVPKGEIRPCTSFKATRSIDIPSQIKSLRNEIKGVKRYAIVLSLVDTLLITLHVLLSHAIGG